MVWFVGSYGVAIVGYVVLNAAASRLLGAQDFGYFVVAITATTLLGQIGLLGVHRSGLREAATMELTDLEGLALLRRGVRAVSLVTLPLIALISTLVTAAVVHLHHPLDRWAVASGVGVLVVLSGQQKIWANYLRGFGRVRMASLFEGRSGGAVVSLLQSALVVAVWQLVPGWGLAGALGATAVGFAIPVLWARSRVVGLWRHTDVRGTLLRDVVVVFRRDWRFTSNQTATYLNSTLELWLAGLVLTRVATSQFGAAQRLALLLVIPLTSLQVVFAPAVSRLLAHDEDSRLEPLLRTGATLATAATAVLWVPMLVFPGTILTLVFTAGFAGAAPMLVLLTVGNIANVLTGLCGTVLIMSHNEGSVATVQWCGVGVRLIAGLAAALIFGPVGLAASAGTVTVALFAAMWFTTKRRMGLSTHFTLRPNFRLIKSTAG
jgi:O-antigen/teichoic acid export membrane protein